MQYRLAAIDLDGTLLNAENRISAGNATALKRLATAGVLIAPATARAYLSAIRPFRECDLEVAGITCGGADVRLAGGEAIHQAPLPDDFVAFAAELCDRAGWVTTLSTAERTFRRESPEPPWAAAPRSWLQIVESLAAVDLSGLLTVLAQVEAGDPFLPELEPWRDRVAISRALAFDGSQILTFTAMDIDKGTALRRLCGALAIDPAEVVVFGDSDVDLPMFEVAGLAVAVGNASDAIKARAGMVTGAAAADGVAQAIAEIWG
jgi:HAD superfamily hydrolase (TIGR01484 family)